MTDYPTPEGQTVFQTLVRAFNYLIAKYDVDGFPIDTLMYIDAAFARHFANAIREFAQSIGKKNFFTFGEVWGSEEQIAHFIGRNALTWGKPFGVDAALDYPLFYKLPAVVKGQLAPSEILRMYEYRMQVETGVLSTHGDAGNYFVTFLDNHDQNRCFFYRDPHQPDAYDDQVSLGVSCLFSLPGIPCLYYGTEQGLSGGGSSSESVREALWDKPDAFSQESVYFQAIQLVWLSVCSMRGSHDWINCQKNCLYPPVATPFFPSPLASHKGLCFLLDTKSFSPFHPKEIVLFCKSEKWPIVSACHDQRLVASCSPC